MLNLELYGMVIYGGVTTLLFLIISVLAYKRLNDEHTNTQLNIAKSPANLKVNRHKNETLFPFYSRITPNMTHQQIQQISAQNHDHRNFKTDESVTETSLIFNTNFWSKYHNKMIPPNILNNDNDADDDDTNPFLSAKQRESTGTIEMNDNLLLSQNVDDEELVFNIIGSRYSLSNTHSQLNITPQMILKNDNSSHVFHKTLSDPECVKHIHLQRQRSRHSLSHLAAAKRTCIRVTVEYFKEMLRNRSIYSPSLQHAWDVATDISVLLKWGKHAFRGTDIDHIDFVPLFWTSLLVQVGYRLVSGYAIFKSERSIKKAMLQICDLLMLREIYVSHIECRITDTLVYIKKLEAVLEAAPQLILTTYFFLRVGTLEHSYTEIIGWLWSFFTLSTKVINDDTKMYKHIKSRWNRQFIFRCLFRLFEICSRVMVIGLVATAVSARAAMAVIALDLVFLLFSYYYGLLSNDKMNILGSLITFVDLTIYPKVSPLYSWYVSTSRNQKRLSRHHKYDYSLQNRKRAQKKNKNMLSQSWTSLTLNKLLTSTPLNRNCNENKSRGKFGKLFDFNIFNKNNTNDHSGSTTTTATARSNLCSLENSVEIKEEEEEHNFATKKRISDLKVNVNIEELPLHDTFHLRSEQHAKKSPMISEIFESHIPSHVHYAQVAQHIQNNAKQAVEEEKETNSIAPSKLNLSIAVPHDENAAIYAKPRALHEGQLSIRERSSYLLKQMTSIEVIYLELQQEEAERDRKYTEYRCCGCCCCWFKCCRGCLPQYVVEICVHKCYLIALCVSWVWCTYCCTLLCVASNCSANKKKKSPEHKTQNKATDNNDAPITKQLSLATDGDIDTEQAPDAELSTSAVPEPEKRVSFSDRFKQLKRKKVRFDIPVLLKDRSKKKRKKDKMSMNCKPNEDASMSDLIPPQLSTGFLSPNSNTVTDSMSVLKMVDFAQQKSCDVADELSSEETPQDWWKSPQGSTKFAVATLRSLHGIDGNFPDLPGLTPVGEYKVDKVYPLNSLNNVAIEEGSEEASFPWKSPDKSNQHQVETFDLLDCLNNAKTQNSTTQSDNSYRRGTITPFSQPHDVASEHERNDSNSSLHKAVGYVSAANDASDTSEDSHSEYVAMKIMAQILEYAGIEILFVSASDSSSPDASTEAVPLSSDTESTYADEQPETQYNKQRDKIPNLANEIGDILIKHSISESEESFITESGYEEHVMGNEKIIDIDNPIMTQKHEVHDEPKSLALNGYLGNLSRNTVMKPHYESSISIDTDSVDLSDTMNPLNLDQYLGNLPRDTVIQNMEARDTWSISMDTNSVGSSSYQSQYGTTLTNIKPANLDEFLGNLPRDTIIQNMDSTRDTFSISMDTNSVGSSSSNHVNIESEHKEPQILSIKPPDLDEYLGNLPRDTIIQSMDTHDELSISMDTNSVGSSSCILTIEQNKSVSKHSTENKESGEVFEKNQEHAQHHENIAIDITQCMEHRDESPLSMVTDSEPSAETLTDSKEGDANDLATLLGIADKDPLATSDAYHPVRNMAIAKSFEMFDSEQDKNKKSTSPTPRSIITYTVSADSNRGKTSPTIVTDSGNTTPFVPNETYRNALLQLAGIQNDDHDADRLRRLFTNPSALNTPVVKSECSTAATTPVLTGGFPDIADDSLPLSRGLSLRDKSMTIVEQPTLEESSEEKCDHLSVKMDHGNTITPSVSALTLEQSPSTEFNVEIMHDAKKGLDMIAIQVDVDNISSGDIYASPYFTMNTPQAKKTDIKPFCGLQKFIFDRGIVHRYAFLVILSRTVQSLLLVPFITYIVYVNPVIFGGKDDIINSNEYLIGCYPWCTSQSLRYELSQSLVFMQFVIACSVTAMLAILCFLLSSPYLLFATSISRSPLSLLKTGCIYDSIQYFSKKAKCTPLQILCDFNFMQMFFNEIIKRRIPVFYCENSDGNDRFYDVNRLHHKILKNADSEILLTALQLNISAQLSERVAIKTIKEGYLHLLQFIMSCTSMHDENKLLFDPSNCVDEDGNALLHVSIIRGDAHIIQYVLDMLGYDPRKNMSNQDVMDLLILHGDIHILRLMLSFFTSAKRLDLTKKTLFKSIKKGNMEFVMVLMEVVRKRYNPRLWITNYFESTQRTLLMCTAMNGHATTTQWLLATMNVDATKQDTEGKTALMHAIINQNVNVVDVFVKDPNVKYYINATCNKGITALLYATMEGSLDCVCTLMLKKKRLDPNICGGIRDETALIHASRYGHQEIALQLIKAKKIRVNIQNNVGKTALMFAAANGLTKTVKALLGHDDIDVDIKDNQDKTALDYVEENLYSSDHYEIIKKKIKAHMKSKSQAQHVDPERLKQKRRSFIMIGELAALQTSNKIKRRYSKTHRSGSRKSIHRNHNDTKESTPINAISAMKRSKRNKSRSKSVLSLKLDLAQAPPPLVDLIIDDVEFYLWYSIQMDYDNVCHWFLQNTRCSRDLVGREDLEMIDKCLVGKNPFHFAVKTGSDKCLRILLEIDGMDKTRSVVNEKDNEGFTPLIYAVMDGKMTIVELLLNYHKTEVNAQDDDDHRTPLMHAAIRGYANIVQLLLDHSHMDMDCINYADKKGQTALCIAVRHNRPRVVQLLIHHKDIEIDKSRTGGRTPLMYAVKNGLLNIVNMLLSTNKVEINKNVESQLEHCKDAKIAKEIASRLTFYKITKERWKNKIKQKEKKHVADLQLFVLNDFTVSNEEADDERSVIMKEEKEKDDDDDDDSEFYRLASKEVETKRVQNDWNTDSVDMEIEDKLFNKWLMQLEILHICAERHDDTVFKELWCHWIGEESIETAIKVQTHYRAQTSSSTMNLYDMLSQQWLTDQVNELLSEKDHFQNLKWYYFMVMISDKGWHRLFIRFIQEIEHRKIKINWKFIPNDPREIELMAKHGHIDELEEYLTRMRKANDSNLHLRDAVTHAKEQSCCYFSNYAQQKHMRLMLESIFENFGQSAGNKPKLGQCLRFVLAKTMSQYLFNDHMYIHSLFHS